MFGDVGRARELIVAASNQHAVLCDNQIRRDEIGAVIDCYFECFQGMTGPLAACSARAAYDKAIDKSSLEDIAAEASPAQAPAPQAPPTPQ